MKYSRHRVNLKVEEYLNCHSLDEWHSSQERLKSYIPSVLEALELKDLLQRDAEDIYFKSLLSILGALNDIYHGLHSWATVKLYYSIYYSLRAMLALNDIAILKNKAIYTLKIGTGDSPKKYRLFNDHEATIKIYLQELGMADILCTNNIDEQNVYKWLKERREQVNYRQKDFYEPKYTWHFQQYSHGNVWPEIQNNIQKYIEEDEYIWCYDQSHACLAIPIKRAILTRKIIDEKKLMIDYDEEKVELLRKHFSMLELNMLDFLI